MLRYFGNKDDCYESEFGYHKFHLLQGPTIKKCPTPIYSHLR